MYLNRKNPLIFPYKLHNTELKSTENAKYLGITISNDFNWKPHIENMTSKAYNTLKFIKRNIETNNQKVKETAYNTYVRPQLEYCAPVCHPWQDKLSYKVERVQRAAARYVLNDYGTTSSVTEMLNTLNWQTLESRRIKSSLILLYETKYQLVVIDHFYLTETRNLNFFVPNSRTKYSINSFSLDISDTGTVSCTASRPAPACVNSLLGWPLSHFSHQVILCFLTLENVGFLTSSSSMIIHALTNTIFIIF